MQQFYYCPTCSAPVQHNAKFCNNCGTQLVWQNQPMPPPQYQRQQQPYQQRYQQQFQQQRQYPQYNQNRYSQQQYYDEPPPKKKFPVLLTVIICIFVIPIIIGAVVALSGGNSGSTSSNSNTTIASTPKTTAVSAIEVTAEQLYDEYYANQVAADAKYKGKIVKVTGVVSSIGKDILDAPYVVLTSGEVFEWGVQCTFSEADESALAQLSKGQTISIQGKVSSFLVNVLVRDCQIK